MTRRTQLMERQPLMADENIPLVDVSVGSLAPLVDVDASLV